MKLLAGLLAFILAVNVAVSLPAHSPQDDAEVIGGPRRVITNRNGFSPNTETDDDDFRGVITSDVGYPFLQTNPHAFSFNWGYFDALNDILRRLKAHLQGMDSGDSSAEPAPGFGLKDQPEVNSTSTVKVVDGHKIEINDTYYGDENSLFKVRLVQIRPLEEDENPVEGTINSDGAFKPNPSTSRPDTDEGNDEETREPLAKNPNDNEINGGNIDDPEVNKIK